MYNNNKKGVGVFISSIFFLTSAQNLFTKELGMQPEKISPTSLHVTIPTTRKASGTVGNFIEEIHFLNVLCFDIHPDYNSKLYLNDIALLLVSWYIKNPKLLVK